MVTCANLELWYLNDVLVMYKRSNQTVCGLIGACLRRRIAKTI